MQEDNDTISKHKKCMELELRKRSPSLDIVADRMSRTFSDRRARISIAMTVADILKEYPALKLCDMVYGLYSTCCMFLKFNSIIAILSYYPNLFSVWEVFNLHC